MQDDVPEPAPESGGVKEINAEQDLVTPTMQGWLLYKPGGLFKNWKKWWVVAHEGKLMCYHGLLDVTPALEAVDLRGVSVEVCEACDTSESSKRAHFSRFSSQVLASVHWFSVPRPNSISSLGFER